MLKTNLGQLLVNEALPKDMQDFGRVIDKKALSSLLRDLAMRHPEEYVKVTKRLSDIGRTVSTRSGGNSFGLAHISKSPIASQRQKELKGKLKTILDDDSLSDEERHKRIILETGRVMQTMPDEVYEEALKEKNPLAYQVLSGSRGNKMNLNELRGTGLLFADHRDHPIPLPILSSYSEGMKPVEYWAGTYGARKGILSTKFAVQDAGFLCLGEGTLVRMADGSARPIEDIHVGDSVLGADCFGAVAPVNVTATFNNGPRQCNEYLFGDAIDCAKPLVATSKHQLLAFDSTSGLRKVSLLVGINSNLPFLFVVGRKHRLYHAYDAVDVGFKNTFDIEVDNCDHLFVLANGAIVSNSKQLNQINHRLMVVDEDDPRDFEHPRGLPVDTADNDNEGALLGHDVGGYKRDTVLTPKILKQLKSQGHERILVRSPSVGGSPDGGVYARDVGVREYGRLAGKGEQVGLQASQALSEPLAQAQLGAKHTGGVAGADKAVGGFQYINQLIQVPKAFKGGASHAEEDGHVEDIEEAPAGGNFVTVAGKKHYIPQGYELKVKKGDSVEAGDVLSEGAANPNQAVKHKGIGEGRRIFTNTMMDAMRSAGLKANRRNVEVLSRGLINHVRLTEEWGGHLPEDVLPYSTVEHLYEPREDAQRLLPARAIGKYLEQPVLHYTIGTKVRPSVMKELQQFGVKDINVHDEPPPFEPEMIRGMYSLQYDPDWMTRMYGSGLKGSLLDATYTGAKSDELGTSFVPSLSRAVDFGQIGQVRQPEPGQIPPLEGVAFPSTKKKKVEIEPPKKTGLFSGLSSLFKGSFDQAVQLQEARDLLVKEARKHPVRSFYRPDSSSSTDTPSSRPARPSPSQPAQQHSAGQPPAPHWAPGNSTLPPSPIRPPVQQNNFAQQPQQQQQPVNPGQIHPDRIQGNDPWAQRTNVQRQLPTQQSQTNLRSGGYTPGASLQWQNASSDAVRNYVYSDGDPLAKLVMLQDPKAFETLTSGSPYSRGVYNENMQGGASYPGAMSSGYPGMGGVSQGAQWYSGAEHERPPEQPWQPTSAVGHVGKFWGQSLGIVPEERPRTSLESAAKIPLAVGTAYGGVKAIGAGAKLGKQLFFGAGVPAAKFVGPTRPMQSFSRVRPGMVGPGGVTGAAGNMLTFGMAIDAGSNLMPALRGYTGTNTQEDWDYYKKYFSQYENMNPVEQTWHGSMPIKPIVGAVYHMTDDNIKIMEEENRAEDLDRAKWRYVMGRRENILGRPEAQRTFGDKNDLAAWEQQIRTADKTTQMAIQRGTKDNTPMELLKAQWFKRPLREYQVAKAQNYLKDLMATPALHPKETDEAVALGRKIIDLRKLQNVSPLAVRGDMSKSLRQHEARMKVLQTRPDVKRAIMEQFVRDVDPGWRTFGNW